MKYDLSKQPNNVTAITVTVPWQDVVKKYNEMIEEVIKDAEIKGFRKGKAPRDLVEKNLNKDTFYTEVLNKIVPDSYAEIIKKNDLRPVVMPRIEVVSREEDKDWVYKVIVCEQPGITLVDYKDEIAKTHAKDKIWVPGKDEKKPEEKDKNKILSENLAVILEKSQVGLADLVIEDELTKLLSELLEEIKKLGLTLDQYLASTGKTVETLRNEYKSKAENSLKLEFILNKIADLEKITVSDEEIQKAIEEVKEEKLKEQLKNSSYQLATLLRRQKTLDYIANL